MGYGLGAAIGAAVGNLGRPVVNFAGDGCFRMNMIELLTAVREGLHIIEIIFDNRSLGMVHQLQRMRFDGRYSQTEFDDNVDYASIASAMGALAFTAHNVSELDAALNIAMADKKPSVIVCDIDRDEVFDLKKLL